VRKGLWAARTTAGLVDPTLVRALEQAGYDRSLAGEPPASLLLALAAAPPRRPARPAPAALWRAVAVDDAAGVIRRPPGVAIDIGGTGKGLAADAVARRLSGRFVVDCGGDLRLSGPYEVEVEHPVTRATAHTLLLASGAIATSGLATRLWERPQGGYAHHLLDPSTGRPAWTGLLSVTACAATALEAETLAKLALLRGPVAARALLGAKGGVLIHESGEVELVGGAPRHRRIRLPLDAAA
jgi:FAD:protein FMN transferase